MKILGLAVLMLLNGCASVVTKRGDGSKYAPTNEVRGGTVKYNNQGFGAAGRRKSAYKRMHQFCGGPYKIISEHSSRRGNMAVPVGGTVMFTGGQEEVYIDFECEGK